MTAQAPRPILLLLVAVACGCGNSAPSVEEHAKDETAASAGKASAVQTTSPPANPCGWIPATEVEAVLGRFAAAPRPAEGGCRYTLVIPDSIVAERAAQTRMMAALGQQPKFDAYAVDLFVDLGGDVVSERAMSMGADIMGGWLDDGEDNSSSASPSAPPKPQKPAGWDFAGPALGRPGFMGRVGHVNITVVAQTLEIDPKQIAPLADRVRDRITDLPFPLPPDRSSATDVKTPDPCGLLTGAEAESVLGKLVVAPYRAAKETPYVDANGSSCAYFTRGHRVLVLTPVWSYGKNAMEAVRGIGGLTATVAADLEAEAADTLEGPWDDVAADGKTGEMFFLKGDRLLQIQYATSSTNSAGAVALARRALSRL